MVYELCRIQVSPGVVIVRDLGAGGGGEGEGLLGVEPALGSGADTQTPAAEHDLKSPLPHTVPAENCLNGMLEKDPCDEAS